MKNEEKKKLLRRNENDRIACQLLNSIDRNRQLAILFPMDKLVLKRVFEIALADERYELCQIICDLLKMKNNCDWK